MSFNVDEFFKTKQGKIVLAMLIVLFLIVCVVIVNSKKGDEENLNVNETITTAEMAKTETTLNTTSEEITTDTEIAPITTTTESETEATTLASEASTTTEATIATEATTTQTTIVQTVTPTSTTERENHFTDYNNPEQQNTTEYVLNTNTLKVHKPSCNSVKDIKPENYSTTNDLQAALNSGYTACGKCHPF